MCMMSFRQKSIRLNAEPHGGCGANGQNETLLQGSCRTTCNLALPRGVSRNTKWVEDMHINCLLIGKIGGNLSDDVSQARRVASGEVRESRKASTTGDEYIHVGST